MKKVMVLILVVSLLVISSCASRKNIEGKTYDTYGLFNEKARRNPNIEYEVSVWSVIWSIVMVETIVVPVYCIGFDLYQPVCSKESLDKEVKL